MKKRAMKKWIPKETLYCYGKNKCCPWRKYITTIKRNKTNCEHADTCNEECWATSRNSCRDIVYRCEYLGYTDYKQDSLLWDACKECGVKDDYNFLKDAKRYGRRNKTK